MAPAGFFFNSRFNGSKFNGSSLGFAIYIYPYIPASKGGGDYSMSHPVQVTFDPRFANAVPPAVTNDLQAHCMILLDANSGVVLLASTNDVGGPAEWRSGASKPTVYEIRREAI